MIALDACMLLRLSSIDGEQFVGDQEYYFDEQDQQEHNPCFLSTLIHLIHVACVTLIGIP